MRTTPATAALRRLPASPARVVLAAALASAAIAHAQGARPFMTTVDGSMAARVDGPSCADAVRLTFVGRDAEAFRMGLPTAARLMNNATTLLRQQCPTMQRVLTRGVVGSQIMYTGVSEAATNWTVVELGAGTGSALLGGAGAAAAAGGPDAREQFGRDPGFVPASKMLEWLNSAATLCVRPESKDNSCAGLNRFEPQASGVVRMTASYRLDANGSTAVLSYPATDKSGFFCTDTTATKVEVRDGALTAAGRADMQAMLLERVQASGNEVCTGYSGNAPASLQTESFGADGSSQTQRTAAALVSTRMALRLDR